jgi:hypothetical protein
MKQAKARPAQRVIRSWAQGRALLERWRRDCARVQVELKRPRVIDVVPIDFLRGEPAGREGPARRKFQGRLIYYTTADVTIRRPSGAILVADHYEIAALSAGRFRIQPR